MRPFDVVAAGMLAAPIALGSNAVLAEPLQRKPNIVVIMTDDAGWEDLVCVSSTPPAAQGLRGDSCSRLVVPGGLQKLPPRSAAHSNLAAKLSKSARQMALLLPKVCCVAYLLYLLVNVRHILTGSCESLFRVATLHLRNGWKEALAFSQPGN